MLNYVEGHKVNNLRLDVIELYRTDCKISNSSLKLGGSCCREASVVLCRVASGADGARAQAGEWRAAVIQA